MNEIYKKYLAGKRVVFVGGCPNLVGRNTGKFIDDFDIVVKTNGSVMFDSDNYYRDYGKRIDVLYVNVQFAREMNPLPVKEWSQRGIKWLCMKGGTLDEIQVYSKYIKVRKIWDILKEVQREVYSATTGLAIFKDILNCNPKEFYLLGVDFFASKLRKFQHDNYQEYLDNYLPDKIREQGNKINIGKVEDGHNFYQCADYIFGLYKKYVNFHMPDYLDKLLNKIHSREVNQQ